MPSRRKKNKIIQFRLVMKFTFKALKITGRRLRERILLLFNILSIVDLSSLKFDG